MIKQAEIPLQRHLPAKNNTVQKKSQQKFNNTTLKSKKI